ncbi:MAG: IMP dehydrogenase, partial [Candidatus Rokubacteria bacterium]|nr:IMP dehydrogenase [Candidatus Rokubacteria bacterium]
MLGKTGARRGSGGFRVHLEQPAGSPDLPLGLTFDDVLVIPGESEVVPRDVDVRTKLTRELTINIPLVSAAMDTVTEARLAIALALSIIHKSEPTRHSRSAYAGLCVKKKTGGGGGG